MEAVTHVAHEPQRQKGKNEEQDWAEQQNANAHSHLPRTFG